MSFARKVLSSDFARRYLDSSFYGGGKFIDMIIKTTMDIAKDLFGRNFAFIVPLSGNISHLAMVLGFSKHGDKNSRHSTRKWRISI